MGANGSSQQTFTAIGPIAIDNYKEFIPKKKNQNQTAPSTGNGGGSNQESTSITKTNQLQPNNEKVSNINNQPSPVNPIQEKQTQNQIQNKQPMNNEETKVAKTDQGTRPSPVVNNQTTQQPQQTAKPVVKQSEGQPVIKNETFKQQESTKTPEQKPYDKNNIPQKQVQEGPNKVKLENQENRGQVEKQKLDVIRDDKAQQQKTEQIQQKIKQSIIQQAKQYRRKANWNIVQNWDKIGSYLHARDIIKLVGLSKPIRKQIVQGVSFNVAQSKYLEGKEYIVIEEEEGEEEEIEEYQDGTEDRTFSPVIEEQVKIEQSNSPDLRISTIDPIRNSAVNQPMTTSFHDKKNESPFKKAQTLNRLASIQETLRETSEIDSLDKKDRAGGQNESESIKKRMNESSPYGNQELEEVMETESRSIYTETEGMSFENSLPREKILKKQDSKKQEINFAEYGQVDNRYQQKNTKDDSTSNAASNLNYMMKTLPSNAENPMQSLRFNEELVYEKIQPKNYKLNHQGQDPAKSTLEFQWGKNESHLKPIDSKAHSSMHLSPGGLDEKDIFHQSGIKKQISDAQSTRQEQIKAFIPNLKHLNAPPKMQLKETLKYHAALPTPMIRIFEEEIDKQSNLNSIKEQQSAQSMSSNITAPKAEVGDTSPRIGANHGNSGRNKNQFPGMKTINKIDAQVENEQSMKIFHQSIIFNVVAKEMAYQQFREIYEKRLMQQKEQSNEAQQKAKKAIEFQKPFTTSRNKKEVSKNTIDHSQTVGSLPLVPNPSQFDETQASLPEINQTKLHQTPSKKNVHFEDQLKELKEDMLKYKMEEAARLPILFQESHVIEDPSGAYTFNNDVHELKTLAVQREIALSGIPYRKSRSGEKLSLLRIEMRKKMLVEKSMREQYQQQQIAQKALNQTVFERSHNSFMDNSFNQQDTASSPTFIRNIQSAVPTMSASKQSQSGLRMTFNNQSRNFSKVSEVHTAPNQIVPRSAMLESLNKQIFAQAYHNPQIFKNLLMKFLCDGAVQEVHQLFSGAPEDNPNFRNSEQFYFAMYHQQVDHNKESKLISPIAVAVNVGDPQLLTVLLQKFGIERRRKSSTVLKQNQTSSVRKTSPLQFACSLGLHRIVEILLLNGANPNNVRQHERLPMIDYHINPLVICMQPKHQDKDLEIEGLAYKRKFDPYSKEDVNHEACMMALIRNKADPNAELFGKRRRPRPIFHAVLQPYHVLKRLMDSIVDRPTVVNQINAYQETPLCLVSGEQGQADNDLKAKLLIDNGASCFASDLNPLHIAIKAKNYKVMRVLYRQGDASPNRNIADEKSPLEMAIIQNDSNLVRELLHWKELQNSLGQFFTNKDGKGRNIMHIIAENKGVEVFRSLVSETNHKYLKEMKQALNQTSDHNQEWLTPLAFCYPNLELAKLFVRYGAEPRHLSFIHQFFAHAQFGEDIKDIESQGIDRSYFNYLVKELQVNVNEIDAHGKDAVSYCYEAYRKDYISFLVTGLGATLDQQTMQQGRTVLLDAAMRGHLDLFEFLLMKGANPMARDQMGKTAIEYIKNDYASVTNAPKTALIKDRMSQILYKYHLSKPFKSMAPPIQKQSFPAIKYVASNGSF